VSSLFIQHISAIVNNMASGKSSNFTSTAVSNLSLQKTYFGTIVCVHCVIVIYSYFTEKCHVLFTGVTESVLCSAWGSCTPVWRLLDRIGALSKVSFPTSNENQTHEYCAGFTILSTGVAYLWYLIVTNSVFFQDLIGIYVSSNIPAECLRNTYNILFWWK